MKVGYARVSTAQQDLSTQLKELAALGVEKQNVHVDHGRTGTNRHRPGLEKVLAAVREGDELVITKLDRLARSITDAHEIAGELEDKGVALNIGGSIYDPQDPMGKLLFSVLGMIAEFNADIIRSRTREGMQVAKAKGRLRGKKPKLSRPQEELLVKMHRDGEHTTGELAQLFNVARSTVYRAVQRAGEQAAENTNNE